MPLIRHCPKCGNLHCTCGIDKAAPKRMIVPERKPGRLIIMVAWFVILFPIVLGIVILLAVLWGMQ